ncbi:MAG: type II toxin-antitoxin system Phd/YefM family antitoxin [Planctomycetia bacterium]
MDNVVGIGPVDGQLALLLERVEHGEELLLVRDGQPVARLLPPVSSKGPSVDAGRELLAFREQIGRRLEGATFRELAAEGRR